MLDKGKVTIFEILFMMIFLSPIVCSVMTGIDLGGMGVLLGIIIGIITGASSVYFTASTLDFFEKRKEDGEDEAPSVWKLAKEKYIEKTYKGR